MSSPRRHTPSSVLRDTLLEYSRGRKKRSKQRARSREPKEEGAPSSAEEARPVDFEQHPPSAVEATEEKESSVEVIEEKESFVEVTEEKVSSVALLVGPSSGDISVVEVPSTLVVDEEGEQIELDLSFVLEDERAEDETPAADIASLGSTSAIFFDFENANLNTAESLQNVPGIDCLCCCFTSPKYYVPGCLKHDDSLAQTHFIQKVFAVFFMKVVIILAWLRIVEMLENFQQFYEDTFQYHFVSGGIYLIIKIAVRITKNFRKKHCCMHVLLFLLEILAACDFMACAITHWLQDYYGVPRKVFFTLSAVAAFYIFVGFFTSFDMRDGIMMGSALIVTGVMSVHQIMHERLRITGREPHAGKIVEELICTAGVFVGSELVMLIVMFELASVLTGRRYSPSPSDWFFTAIYII